MIGSIEGINLSVIFWIDLQKQQQQQQESQKNELPANACNDVDDIPSSSSTSHTEITLSKDSATVAASADSCAEKTNVDGAKCDNPATQTQKANSDDIITNTTTATTTSTATNMASTSTAANTPQI